MIYKIGTIADMDSIVFENDDIKQLVYRYARILTDEYGTDRNIDTYNRQYILYATMVLSLFSKCEKTTKFCIAFFTRLKLIVDFH